MLAMQILEICLILWLIAYRKEELGGAVVCLSSAKLLDVLFSGPTVGISGNGFLLLSKWKKNLKKVINNMLKW
jgi:hypothetical protein